MNILLEKNICKFLKKINTISTSKELAKFTAFEFLELTSAEASCFCLLSSVTNTIEIKTYAYAQGKKKSSRLVHAIEQISKVGVDMLTNNFENEDIIEYLNSISKDQVIIEPIYYKNTVLGFVALVNKNRNFKKHNALVVESLMEAVNSRIEIISLNDELKRTNQEKVQFLASISHEYKTPLNSIIGFSDMLKSELEGTKSYKYIDNISKSSKFLLSLIQDILDMARSEYKQLELKYETFRPKDVIKDIIYSFDEVIKEKNINFSYTLMDVEITADLKRFKQLIFNLISNALKFNKIGGKIVVVTYVDENKNYIFEIKDSGDGIRKKDYDKIFNFFSQVNRNKLKRQQGSGVGLALCKVITDAHKGNIGFKSRLNNGSTFWFSLPQQGCADTSYIEF